MKDRIFSFILVSTAIILMVIIKAPFINSPLDCDEGGYAYLGQSILKGELIYKDVMMDQKLPGVPYLYALSFILFGQVDAGIRIFSLLYTVFTIIALFALAKAVFDRKTALISILLYAVFGSAFHIEGALSNTEMFFALPAILGFYFYVKSESNYKLSGIFAAGIFFAIACLIKQVSAVFLLAVYLHCIIVAWVSPEKAKNIKIQIKNLLVLTFGFT